MQGPKNSGSLYFNYKGRFSIVLMAVCDASYNFTLVDIGQYGDSSVLNNSEMGKRKRAYLIIVCLEPEGLLRTVLEFLLQDGESFAEQFKQKLKLSRQSYKQPFVYTTTKRSPAGFVDSFDDSGNILPGEWRRITSAVEDSSALRNLPAARETRYRNYALESHVDDRYKRSLINTLLDRACRLSSDWSHFHEECDRLREVFSKLKYPQHLIDTVIKKVIDTKVSDPQPYPSSQEKANTVRVILPFKDQGSANIVKQQLSKFSLKVGNAIQPVFVSRKLNEDLKVQEAKPSIVNQQCVVYEFKCNLCDAGYVGYTRGHLHERVDGHKRKWSSIYKHYHLQHNDQIPQRFLELFNVLAKCTSKFDCLVHEMLFIRKLKPELNVQTDSIRAKVFV